MAAVYIILVYATETRKRKLGMTTIMGNNPKSTTHTIKRVGIELKIATI